VYDDERWQYHNRFLEVFRKVEDLAIEDHVPQRVRCLLRDVLDLRKAHWQDQRLATKKLEGPTTLDQVAQKAIQDEKERLNTPKGSSSGSMGWNQASSRGGNKGGGSWEQQGRRGGKGDKGAFEQMRHPDKTQASPGQQGSQPSSHEGSRQGSRQASPGDSNNRYPQAKKEAKVPPSPSGRPKRPLDLDRLRKELKAAVKELSISHDFVEAMRRVKELQVPAEHQAGELSHILQQACEEATNDKRSVCFRFVVQLLLESIFAKSEILIGLTKLFTDSYKELRLDMPTLPSIMRDELLPALGELSQAGLLKEEELEELARHL